MQILLFGHSPMQDYVWTYPSYLTSILFSSLFTVSFRIRRDFGAKQPWPRTNLLLPNGLQSSILMSWLGKKRCVVIFTLLEIFVLRDMIQRNLHCFDYIKFIHAICFRSLGYGRGTLLSLDRWTILKYPDINPDLTLLHPKVE